MKKANTVFLICLLLLVADFLCFNLSFPIFRESFSISSGLILAIQGASIVFILVLLVKLAWEIRKNNKPTV